jgi:hypothetical protein
LGFETQKVLFCIAAKRSDFHLTERQTPAAKRDIPTIVFSDSGFGSGYRGFIVAMNALNEWGMSRVLVP